ncbi:MAG: metal ABC transporter substrate-binding protein [Actinomycetota bacterium]|nr:metal ABC transporter substrate-binding protein [Actinomycetota bacterium]
MRWPRASLPGIVVLLAGACAGPAGGNDGRLRVVATVSPITNIVQNVGGDRVRVTGIVPEGSDSHTFEPAPTDARVLAEADAVFVNGLNLELPTMALARSNVRTGVPVVALGEATVEPGEYIYDFGFPEAEGDPNPHLWTNPPFARRYAEIVRDTLSRLDPAGAPEYEANQDAFADRIEELDRLVRTVTATVPPGNRRLLTYHDSFPYFAREYGWEIIGAVQPSDFSDPTPREVAALIDQIRDARVPAIFGSEVFPSPVLEEIAAATGAEYVDDLRDDDLPGSPGDPEHSYLGLMVFDFRTFMGALGGDVSAFDALDVSDVAGRGSAEYRG